MRKSLPLVLGLFGWLFCGTGESALLAQPQPPVFDVHLHALSADAQGPPPLGMCMPLGELPAHDPDGPYGATFMKILKEPACDEPIWSPETDEELLAETVAVLERRNVYGVLSGTPSRVADWMKAHPGRFLAGHGFRLSEGHATVDELRDLHEQGRLEVLAEVTNQYLGIEPADARMEPFWSLAEELDIPVGIHIGPGPPGVHYLGEVGYRAHLHSALTLEEVLVRHPGLRVYIMHAGFPLIDDLLTLLWAHPQVYVGTGVIVFTQQPSAFYRYLERIVEGGFGKRVMFGSDQMVWPGVIEPSIRLIEEAPFLSESQVRDILYDNAARFFRFDAALIARHEAGQ